MIKLPTKFIVLPWPIYTEHRTKGVGLESSSKRGSDKINR